MDFWIAREHNYRTWLGKKGAECRTWANTMSEIGNKLWGFAHQLRHDGIGYTDYVEQISYLLFLKIAQEKGVELPKGYDWEALSSLSGEGLLDHYTDTIRTLGKQTGVIGSIFGEGQNRFTKPVQLKQIIGMIDEIEWTELDIDIKGKVYEELLERTASEGKKGAGQYFTPRPLIRAIVKCIQPDLTKTADFKIHDPACGTGGFLLSAAEWLRIEYGAAIPREVQKRMRNGAYSGADNTPLARRLAMMNIYLHELGGDIKLRDSLYDSDLGERYDCVLTNPPFGVRGANQAPQRDDFTIETSNKQLNFLQHVMTILKPGGRCGIVLPDNVLFQGHAAPEVMEILTKDCNLHTVLRLPRGTFSPYSAGTKTNVFFFVKGLPTEKVWIYDGRSGIPGYTKKDRPLLETAFNEFIAAYGKNPSGTSKRAETERFRAFPIKEIANRKYNLDIRWLKDDVENGDDELGEPGELLELCRADLLTATQAIDRLTTSFSTND
ncbi:MAG: N-6 DNA methylase [Fimbriimonadales bacterium]